MNPPPVTAGGVDLGAAPCLLFAYHEIGYVCMRELLAMGAPIVALYTHPDRPDEEVWWSSCADLAARHRIPVFFDEHWGAAELERLRSLRPAIIYSFYYRNLLPEEVLRLAPRGAYNLHGSLLPRYRGRAPVNWMIINGETEGGVTLHHMVARADAGDIVGQRAVPITESDTALSLYRKLLPEAAALIRDLHPLIVAGRAPRFPQDLAAGSYFGRRTPADGRIDWNWPARRIYNLVRALTHPYPGAFCTAAGRKLLVWQASIGAEEGRAGDPGQIVGAVGAGLQVAAGAGIVVIGCVQFEGEQEGPACEVLGRLASALYPVEANFKLV